MSGVAVPQSQRRSGERGTPNTVLNVAEAKLVAVEYTNGEGIVIKEFWYRLGDRFYQPKGAEEFAGQLREVKSTYSEQVRLRLDAQSASVQGLPVQDAVDVVSQKVAKSTEKSTT